MADVPRSVRLPWPIGPRYDALNPTATSGAPAWVAYKLDSAEWYRSALKRVDAHLGGGDFDRWKGVEMAADGALNALSGAFDATVAAMIVCIEAAHPQLKPTEEHRRDWSGLCTVTLNAGANFPGLDEARIALLGQNDPAPVGWLAQMRRLRNRVTHQTTASRHFNIGGGPRCLVKIPGGEARDLLEYLADMQVRTRDLVQLMLSDAHGLAPFALFDLDSASGRQPPPLPRL